jgi:hypothetical protein
MNEGAADLAEVLAEAFSSVAGLFKKSNRPARTTAVLLLERGSEIGLAESAWPRAKERAGKAEGDVVSSILARGCAKTATRDDDKYV